MSDRPILKLKKRKVVFKPKPKVKIEPEPKPKPKPKPKKEPPKPKPKPKPKKEPPKPLDESCISKAERADKFLSEKYEMWAKCLPFQIGLGKVILVEHRRDFSHHSMRLVLKNHVSKVEYLNNIIDMDDRYNLAGEVGGEIKERDKKHAEKRLNKLAKQEK